jgi:hypothetical protein
MPHKNSQWILFAQKDTDGATINAITNTVAVTLLFEL